jgi:hypothetical protein
MLLYIEKNNYTSFSERCYLVEFNQAFSQGLEMFGLTWYITSSLFILDGRLVSFSNLFLSNVAYASVIWNQIIVAVSYKHERSQNNFAALYYIRYY